ncbi:MAG: hypothetical protein QNJ14_16385 [Woeseiaceae bacterium]|nr:hypothetical protein [Woeseiaceae bacterium]
MNKVMIAATVAGGLLLMNSPEAAAHKEVRIEYNSPGYYHPYDHVDVRRVKHMPRWLKRNRGFRHWYRHTPLKRNKRLAWNELFYIYKWERRWGRNYYRSHNYWNDYFAHRYRHHDRRFDDRYDKKDRRRRHRHRHDD